MPPAPSSGFGGADAIDPDLLLELDVDLLVPAAIEGVIHAGNAERIRARLIVEGANGPTTADADEILQRRGVTVVPDILANAGGVIVLLLRVGAGQSGLLVDRGSGQRAVGRADDRRLARCTRLCRSRTDHPALGCDTAGRAARRPSPHPERSLPMTTLHQRSDVGRSLLIGGIARAGGAGRSRWRTPPPARSSPMSADGDTADATDAVEAAHGALPGWRNTPARTRSEALARAYAADDSRPRRAGRAGDGRER